MDTVAAARSLHPEVRRRADEIEHARRLPADLAQAFARAGFFRMAVPRSVGGLELDPASIMGTIEAVGQADASAGWNVMIGATSGMSGAYLDPDAARESDLRRPDGDDLRIEHAERPGRSTKAMPSASADAGRGSAAATTAIG
jgi:alkylation response protein AidB-like acyl-CoA dehydrogenase